MQLVKSYKLKDMFKNAASFLNIWFNKPGNQIILIVLFATLLRIIHINHPYFEMYSWREASTAMMAKNLYEGKTTILYPEVNWGGPGPCYQGREFQTVTFIASELYKIFGLKEWVGRAVSIFFGLIGILAFFGIVSEVWDKKRALLSALILSILPGNIYLERSFLPDPAMVSLILLSLYFSIIYIKRKKIAFLIMGSFFGCLGVLTKLNGAVLGIPFLYLFIFAIKRGFLNKIEIGRLIVILVLILVTVASYYLWVNHLASTYPPYHFAGAGKFLSSFSKLSEWIHHGYFIKELYYLLTRWLWGGPVFFLFFVGITFSPIKVDLFRWLFHFWVLAMVVQFIVEANHLVIDAHNALTFNPAAAFFSADVLIRIKEYYKRISSRLGVLLVLSMSIFIILFSSYGEINFSYSKLYYNQYKIGLKLKEIANEKDLVITLGQNPITIYYSGLNGWLFPPAFVWKDHYKPDYGEKDASLLEELTKQGADWIVIPKKSSYIGDLNLEELEYKLPVIYDYITKNYIIQWKDEFGLIYKNKNAD